MADPTRIVQVTDLHLMADPSALFCGVNTARTAERVFGSIRGMDPGPDLVVATGDLTNDGEVESYRVLRDLADTLACPTRCALGNHDSRRGFRAAWEGQPAPDDSPLDCAFDFQDLRLILLDSTIPGEEGGRLDAEQVEWLEGELAAHRAARKLIFLHHHPLKVGSPWMDGMMLSNGEDFFRALSGGKESILGIFFGHVHQDFEAEWEGVPIFGTRPTSVPFTPETDRFIPSKEPPGYRLIEISDLSLTSRTVAVR